MDQILLKENKRIGGVNDECSVNAELSSSSRLFPLGEAASTIDVLKEYNIERDDCHKYRIIADIKPFCSNVLFNRKSEIVKDEEGFKCRSLNYGVTSLSEFSPICGKKNIDSEYALRNTEFSHKELGNLSYHCGVDIFNNHRFRGEEFNFINQLGLTQYYSSREQFNTMSDMIRDNRGENVFERIPYFYDRTSITDTSQALHVYRIDNTISFEDAYARYMESENGWYGFRNKSDIDIPVGYIQYDEKYSVNKVLNNRRSGEFIDFFPERDKFSFLPHYNSVRKREELNWDYCLTYPYMSDKKLFNSIMENYGDKNFISVVSRSSVTMNADDKKIVMKTKIRHNLKKGDYVLIDFTDGSEERVMRPVMVQYIGNIGGRSDDREYYFCVNESDCPDIVALRNENRKIGIKKISGQVPCEYYFRWFKKIKNSEGKDLKSSIGKLGFSKTLFGDDNCEVVFTDSVDTEGLKDNRGRQISEIFMTIVKRNAGSKEWYGAEKDTASPNIELSHCFGKVTSGLELAEESIDYNVHRLTNVDFGRLRGMSDAIYRNTASYYSGIKVGKPLASSIDQEGETEISIENDVFLGDIVEYDPLNDIETVIERVYYRFNTAQREYTVDDVFGRIMVDNITTDDYDVVNPYSNSRGAFKLDKENISVWQNGENASNNEIMANIAPEGYYYSPHYRIQLRSFRKVCTRSEGILINSDPKSIKSANYLYNKDNGAYEETDGANTDMSVIIVKSPKDYGFGKNDKFLIYDKKRVKDYWGTLYKVENNDVLYISVNEVPEEINSGRYNIVMTNGDTPECSSYLNNVNQTFVWRKVEDFSEMESSDPLYDSTYSNGCIYKEESIMFYLKRQDPFGEYGLRGAMGRKSKMNRFVVPGNKYDKSKKEFIIEHNNITC